MHTLTRYLHTALDMAQKKNRAGTELAFKSAYGEANVLGSKGFDVLVDLEHIVERIKKIAE